MSQQNQQSASGDCMTSERPSVFASAAEQKILGILKHGPAIVALRRTPSDGVKVEILAQCHCELAPNKHEGAEHRSDCPFMKALKQLDILPPAIAPQKSQPACDEVPKASPGLRFPTIHDLNNPRYMHPGAIFQEEIMKAPASTATEARRSDVDYLYAELNWDFIKMLAQIAWYADTKYGCANNYTYSELKGNKAPLNHIPEHLRQYFTGERHDHFGNPVYHLAAIAYNAMMEYHYWSRRGITQNAIYSKEKLG